MLQEPKGINYIKDGERISWRTRLKDGSPQLIRDEVYKIAEYYNASAAKLKLNFRLNPSSIDKVEDMDLVTRPGFEAWLSSRKVVATPVSVEQALRVVQYHQEKLFASKWGKTFINCMKGCKAGKSKDIQQSTLMTCAIHYAKNGIFSRPMFLLTARKDGEAQLIEQWKMVKDFFYFMEIEGDDSWKTPKFKLSSTIDKINLERDLVRRVGGATQEDKFNSAVEEALTDDIHLVICNDEADEGMKKESLQVKWLGEKVVPYLKDGSGKICQFNWTATSKAYECVWQHGVNLKLDADSNYLALSEVPKVELNDFTRILDLGVTKIGYTCHPQSHPYCNKVAYVNAFYATELSNIKDNEDKEEFIQRTLDDPNCESCWTWYKETYIPFTLSEIFLRSMQLNKDGYAKIGGLLLTTMMIH